MPNPFDPFGWLGTFFTWFVNSWLKSGGESLQQAITMLASAQWPDLTADWFRAVWGTAFGLGLAVGLGAVTFHALMLVFRDKYESTGAAIVNFFKLVLNGLFLLGIVFLCMGAVDFLISVMTAWIDGLVEATTWTNILTMSVDISSVNVWFRLGIGWAGMMIGNSLYINALLMNFWIYFFLVWYLISSALGMGKISQLIRSAVMGAMLTILFARVFQIFHLGLSAVILSVATSLGMPPIAILLAVLFVGGVAVQIPIFMWFVITFFSYRVERRLDVREFYRRQAKNVSDSVTQEQLADQKVGKLQSAGNGVKDAATGALRWAAIAATSAAITKGVAAVGAKIGASTPTPQTKVAAAGLLALNAASGWAENKANTYINNRIGRPGAGRARARMRN